MANGGKRAGAGRKKGGTNQATRVQREAAAIAVASALAEGISPLGYMLEVLRDKTQDYKRRDWAAHAAARYVHPTYSSIEAGGPDGGPITITITSDDAEF